MKVGDKIKFVGEKQRFTVQALNERFVICTKPFNLWAWAISIVGVYFKVPVYVAVPIIMLPLAIYFITNQK